MADISVTRDIAASNADLWSLITDLPRMAEWSTENTGGRWAKGATGPALGAKFKGTNANGAKRWETLATITSCDPGKSFGFLITVGPVKVAEWHYGFADLGGDVTRVTESWTERRPKLLHGLGKTFSGVQDRRAFNEASMKETLARIDAHVSAATH